MKIFSNFGKYGRLYDNTAKYVFPTDFVGFFIQSLNAWEITRIAPYFEGMDGS